MVEKNETIIELVKQRGAMGVVLSALANSAVVRTKENFEKIKEKLLLVPVGIVESDQLIETLSDILHEKELILVGFRKTKTNGKVGHKRIFEKGFSYYIGEHKTDLKKMYLHWGEEKKFLLGNIGGLKNTSFQVEKNINEYVPKVFCLDIFLYKVGESETRQRVDVKPRILEAEITFYIGYNNKIREKK